MKEFLLPKRTLYPSKKKAILMLIICLVFVVAGIFMIKEGDARGWFVALFFGLGVIVGMLNLLPQASYLTLDNEGFETCSLFRKHRHSWDDFDYFGVGKISGNKMVMFNYSEKYQKAKTGRKVASAMTGAEGALHDTFGLKAETLAKLMNTYKMASHQSES